MIVKSAQQYLGTGTQKYSPEDTLLQLFKAEKTVSALANVLNYIITDAFDLSPEESIWVSRLLGPSLEPLKKIIPTAILGAVTVEMTTGAYSTRMFQRSTVPTFGSNVTTSKDKYEPNVLQATSTDWVEGICQIIFDSYPSLRPALRSRIIGQSTAYLQN